MEAARSRVRFNITPRFHIEDHDGIRGVLDQRAIAGLGAPTLSDVADDVGEARDPPRIIAHRGDGDRDVYDPPVLADARGLIVGDVGILGQALQCTRPDAGRPMISRAANPKSRSAPSFQDVTLPARSVLMIASLEDSTMDAS